MIDDIYEVKFKDTHKLNVFMSETIKSSVSKLFSASGVKVLINLEDIHFLDSSGFAAFLSLSKEASKTGGQIIFCNISESAMRLFKVLQLHQPLLLVGSREEALRSFR
ncbi:MAG: STAS domain-containing protein [Bacteroidales bacterium]|nr:STAS domain-containing protein [Bacteroidales bacterium]